MSNMAEVNGADHLVSHEKESKLNGYDNEGYHCQERSEDEEESASDDDRLRVVVTENGHRPEDDSHMSNGFVHEETNGHSTTVNGSAVIVIEENKSDSSMNDNNKEDSSQKPLDTRLHHFVPVDDIDRKLLNGSDGTHVTIPEDAIINFTTGRVKVRKGSSNNSQVSNERESIPLETMLPSYEAEDKIGLGEKAELEAELTNHKNGLWSEDHNTYSNAESPFGNSEKLNGASKSSSDEISLPVNSHRKCLSSDLSDTSSEQKPTGEKLYFTEESRKLCPGWRRVFVCGLILIIIAVALLLGVLAATGILLAESGSKNSRYESGHSLPSSDFISQTGHSLRSQPSSKVPQNFSSSEGTNTITNPVSQTSPPTVSSKVPVLNDTSHSQTIVPNALVGEFTIDEIFTDDLKDNTSNGYQSLAKYIERELHDIFKRNGGDFEVMKILSFSSGSIKIKFVTIWSSDRNIILSTKAVEMFKSYLKGNRNSLLAYPVDLESIHFIDVFDECRVQKGGCSFDCIWDYNTLSKTCVCEENMNLLADGKSCGPKTTTSTFENTTPKFINSTSSNTPKTITDHSVIKESLETAEVHANTTPSSTMLPTIVTKAIISITELFHNLTSTESPFHVTENSVNLQNLSTVMEYFSSDIQTTTKPYSSEEPTVTEKPTNFTHSPDTQYKTTDNTLTSPISENKENVNTFNESDVTEINIKSYPPSTSSAPITELETTTISSLVNPNNPMVLSKQYTTATVSTDDSHIEIITDPLITEHTVTQEDLTTIGYHIKEETTEMYTIEEIPKFITTTKPGVTTEEPVTSTTNFKVTNNIFFPNSTTESVITTEGTQSPEIETPKNASEVIKFNVTYVSDSQPTETTVTTESFQTTMMNIEEENVDTTDLRNNTDISNEETLNKNNANFTLPSDILNETSFTGSVATDTFITTTFEPLTITPQSKRPPEVRSFDEDYENETSTQNIDTNGTDIFLNESSLLTTTLPTIQPLSETTPYESTTEKSVILETTTPNENKPETTTRRNSTEATVAPAFSEDDIETTDNTELTSTLTTESSHISKNYNVTNDDLGTTITVFDSETTTILPTEVINSEKMGINSSTEAENATFKNNTETNTTLENSTEINITLENGTEINIALENSTEINSTLENSTDINTTLERSPEINTTLENSTDINTTLEKSPEINTTLESKTENNTALENSTEINTTLENNTETNTTFENNTEINTTLENSTAINTILVNNAEINATIENNTEINATIENNTEFFTTLPSTSILENGAIYSSIDSKTTKSLLHGIETTTNSYGITTEQDTLKTILPNTENGILTTITESSTNPHKFNSSAMANNTNEGFVLFTTSKPTDAFDESTTLGDANTLEDSDLTSLETSNFSNSNTELPINVTSIQSSDSNETLTITTVQNYTLSTPPFPNGSDIEITTESVYDAEIFTFEGLGNETTLPFDMDSNLTITTDRPFESSFLEINSTLIAGFNESLENSTLFREFADFTTEGYEAANETTTNASTGIECREDQFLCEPLSRCINDTFMCDGIEDCPDGHDEFECKLSCHSNFRCANSSTCIMSEARCDGIWDCENGTDEQNCTPTECAQHEVMCSDHSKCIKPVHICDWKYNCLDRSDEVGCVERTTCESSGRFFCNDGLCIPWSLKCDGEHDCKEGEDEGNCTCLNDEFQCNDGKCLKSSSRCDGHQDCHDADDEMGCVTVDNQHMVSTYEPYSGTWGLLCAEQWNLDDGQYLCQELGFGHALNVERVHVSFNGTWMAMRRENLTESSLWTERVSFVESCTSGLAAAVECQKFVCGEYTGLLHRRKRDVISSSSNQWPFIGYTSTFQSNKGCLSEILTPIWLITSADCLLSISKEPFNGSDWYVRTNIGRDIEADLAQNHEVLRIINHPHSSKFRSLTLRDYDVALIRLKHALVFVSDKIGAICPPEEQVPPGITCFSGVLGTEKPRAPPPSVLTINSLALQIIDRRYCNRVEHFNNSINQRMLCTQSSEGHTICDNDEGTPLMCLTGINKWFLAGMLTYQRFCDVYNKHPAVFSNLFSMRKFLDQVTGQKQYEVSYDNNMYAIIPPTTPSPTMPETTTPEITTLGTTEFSLTDAAYLTTAEFENETSNLKDIIASTEMNEELAREDNYTTVLSEGLIGTLNDTAVNEDYWNETVITSYENGTGVQNTTLVELEKSADEVSPHRMHDDLTTLVNDTYLSDDAANGTINSNVSIGYSNVTTVAPPLQATTILLESTNIPTVLELNDSLSTTTEFMAFNNETTTLGSNTTKSDKHTSDTITDTTTSAYPSITTILNTSADYSKLTTSGVSLIATDLISVFNDTTEVFKPLTALTNESKVISEPLVALIDDSKEFESPTTMSNLEFLRNTTDNISTDIPLIELHNKRPPNIDLETTVASTKNVTDFKDDAIIEVTTQPIIDETEAVTFVVEGEPNTDLAFSIFKNSDGLKLESYRMLEDNDSSYIPEENLSLSTKQDTDFSFATEKEATLIPTVATIISPGHSTNESGKQDFMFVNATDNFKSSVSPTSSQMIDSSMNFTSEIQNFDTENGSISSPSNFTENQDETVKDENIPKSENQGNDNLNYSMPLTYGDNSAFYITNESLYFSNETEKPDLIFYNITEKTVPKLAGPITDNINYSVPLTFEDDSKSDIETKYPLLFSNKTERHNVTEKLFSESIDPTADNIKYSFPFSFKNKLKSDIENISLSSPVLNEQPTLELDNVTDKSTPESLDSIIIENMKYSAPLTFKDGITTDTVNTLSFDNMTEKHDLEFDKKAEKPVQNFGGLIVDDMKPSTALNLESDNTNTLSLSHSHNFTENHDLQSDSEEKYFVLKSEGSFTDGNLVKNMTNNFFPKSEYSFTDDMNHSTPPLNNISSLSYSSHLMEEHGLLIENVTGNVLPKSEVLFANDMKLSTPLTHERENTNISLLAYSPNMTEEHGLLTENVTGNAFPKSEVLFSDDVKLSTPLTHERDNTNIPLLAYSSNVTEEHGLLGENITDKVISVSEGPFTDYMKRSTPLPLEREYSNMSSLSFLSNMTEEHGLLVENMTDKVFSKSEDLLIDDMNHSTPLTLEKDNTNISLSNSSNLNYLLVENVTDKVIPKSEDLMIKDTINYSLPLIFDEDGKFGSVNESLTDYEDNKATTSILETELDAAPMKDSVMKMHLTSEELNVLPDNNTLSNMTDCGIWPENSGTVNTSEKQDLFKLWPAVGDLQMTSESKTCPSTVISSKYVITSLNCLVSSNKDLDPDKWTYVGGLYNSAPSSGVQNQNSVNKIIPYPGIPLLLNEHDIALVRLNDTININEYSKSACVAQERKPGQECFIVGWNKNNLENNLWNQFYSFPLTLISTEECNNTMNYNGMLINDLICGVRKEEIIQNCYMELGSPLFCLNENKRWQIQGILNIPGPCDMIQPIVFSNILSISNWITEIVTSEDTMLDTN